MPTQKAPLKNKVSVKPNWKIKSKIKSKKKLLKVKKKIFEFAYDDFDWVSLIPAPVIGVDEVGRGCLAGPVYAAAVILGESFPEGLNDSKKLSEKRRDELSPLILEHCRVGIGFATAEEIDEINILQASFLAMRRAFQVLGLTGGHVIVDGHQKIPELGDSFTQTPLVKGDFRAMPIAAASIVAKVARDQVMKEYCAQYPQYGFSIHKGYGTSSHRAALKEHGPCPLHRRSFAGVLEEQCLLEI